MSSAQAAPQIPDQTSAFENLFHGVREKAFFHKLASHGLVPQNETQAQNFLKLAEDIRYYKQHPQVKQANAAADPVAAAVQDLEAHMRQRGLIQKTAGDELFINRVAEEFAADPTLFNSVLSLKVAEAQEAASRFGLAVA